MKCEKCGHTKHEGSAVIMGVGAMITFMALDHLVFKGAVGQKAFWVYLVLCPIGCAFGWWRDRKANEEEEKKPEEKEVKFADDSSDPPKSSG